MSPGTSGNGMETLLFALTSLAQRWLEARQNAQVQFLKEQIRILRARIPHNPKKFTAFFDFITF